MVSVSGLSVVEVFMGNSMDFSESPDCLHKTSFYLTFDIFNRGFVHRRMK